MHKPAPDISRLLLRWYARHGRDLPWRAGPGERPDAYRVWLSEIMLQQTTVATVRGRFEAFVRRWPDVFALAAAAPQEVMSAWAGLGYYARARNLHKCARVVAHELGGEFPRTPDALMKLPGIGPYTAGAIAAIAFNHPAVAMDTNAERVMARLFAVQDPLPGCRARLRALAEELLPAEAPGDFAQALMDLGAMVCTARKPECARCVLRARCAAHAQGMQDELPRRAKRAARPTRTGEAFWITTTSGRVLLRRRAPRGMLGGMVEIPSLGWDGAADAFSREAPMGLPRTAFTEMPAEVRHTFTHFHLRLKLLRLKRPLTDEKAARLRLAEGCFWHPLAEMDNVGLPTLMRKACRLLEEPMP